MSDDLTGRQLGGFRLVELLGSGAHGNVWRARQTRLDRDVAVKILDPTVARDPMAARRFEREGRAAALLDHPNVVPVYEAGEADGIVYLAMRLVEGETLEDRLASAETLSVSETLEVIRPVAAALDHAHERGVVHRDVKPSNILLGADTVWLADFGIAASVRDLGTYTTGVLGTAEYMAPEQANAGEVDRRADLYGLGCVTYRALQGTAPFPGDDLISTLMAHVNDDVPSTGDHSTDAFFATALAKNPDDRFQSGAEMVTALEALTVSSGPSSPERTSDTASIAASPSTRTKALAVVLALAVAAAGFVAWSGLQDDEPENAATTTTASTTAASSIPSTAPPSSAVSTASSTTPTTAAPTTAPVVGLASGGTVEVGTTRSLLSVNPHSDRFIEPFITANVLPPLMIVNRDWSFSPWLAASEPIVTNADPLTVRWTLRDDATWNDGSKITSRDVATTLDYIQDPASALAGTLLYVNASVEIVDDVTFDLVFSVPVGAHAALFSTIHPIIKADAYDAHLAAGNGPDTFLADGIDFSGGPYLASGFNAGERLTLVRNDAWWGEAALLDRITVRTYDSARAQLDAMEVGELDLAYIEDARATDSARARGFADTLVDVGVADQFLRLDMNTRSGPLADVSVRQAVAAAIDRRLITEAAVTPISGQATKALQSLVWAAAQPENQGPFTIYDGDTSIAAALLQDAGWLLAPDGTRSKDGQLLEIELLFAERSSLAEQSIAQSLVLQLGDVGVRVVASVLDGNDLFAARASGSFDMVIALDVVNTDPIAAVFRFGSEYCPTTFSADGCTSQIPTNLTGIADDELDALFAQSSIETDAAARDDLFVAADQRLAELVPSLPLYELPTFVAHTERLRGIVVDTHRGGPFANVAEWGYLDAVEIR